MSVLPRLILCTVIPLTPFVGRRRKIRCQSDSSDSERCSACANRGIACEKWEPLEEPPASNDQLDSRLQRVERILDRLIGVEEIDGADSDLEAPSGRGSITAPIEGQHQPPLISLFDNAVVCFKFA